jgi:hypothetical protein
MAAGVTVQNDPVDPSAEFQKQRNHFFVGERVEIPLAAPVQHMGELDLDA